MSLALRNLARRPLRSALTLAGVALGAATYFVLAAAAEGVLAETESVLRNLRIDLIVQRANIPVPWNSRISPDELDALAASADVVRVVPLVIGVTRIETRPRFFVFGVPPDSLGFLGVEILNGRVFALASDELLAGVDAARELDLKPGDRVAVVGRRELTVVGIYRTGRRIVDGGVLVDLPAAQQAFRMGEHVNLALVGLAPGTPPEEAAAAVGVRLPELEATPADLFARQQAWMANFRRFAGALALLALAIAALGISNTMSMSVAERTGEIGLLRALGWRRWRIARLVLAEGLLLAFGGAVLGFPVAAVALRLLKATDSLGIVPGQVSGPTLAGGVVTAVAAALLACLPSLVHALRIRPARALRQL